MRIPVGRRGYSVDRAGALERVCLPVGGRGYSAERVRMSGCAGERGYSSERVGLSGRAYQLVGVDTVLSRCT